MENAQNISGRFFMCCIASYLSLMKKMRPFFSLRIDGICCQLLPCQKKGFSLPSRGFIAARARVSFVWLVLTEMPAAAGYKKLMGDD
ncbi:MAG: hypothetical protein ACMV0I_03625 [Pseudomonas sp.]